jgi:simple sugar transport system ATP-binding protein
MLNNNVDNAAALITLNALSKSFGGHQALKNITLTLNQGEVHCLAGANGCGKSTLIKTISGVYAPDAGSEIIIDDKTHARLTPDRARALGIQVIYQDLSLFPNLTVAENIAFEYNLKAISAGLSKKTERKSPADPQRTGVQYRSGRAGAASSNSPTSANRHLPRVGCRCPAGDYG